MSVTSFSIPARAPALGSTTNINTLDGRLQMAVYRAGSLWTCHAINAGAGSACRWYELNPHSVSLVQSGTAQDSSLYFYEPSLMVNAVEDVVMGFSGSDASQYVAAYFTGRREQYPAGLMAWPTVLKPGEESYNLLDGTTPPRNRWGDYSYTTLDPEDNLTFWTIQEYAANSNGAPDEWGTWIGEISFATFDCNSNGTADGEDIAEGTSLDCNTNGRPDECEPDCNTDGIADTCEISAGTSLDCNSNGIPDACDTALGTALDCNTNGTPDSCDFYPDGDCNGNCVADDDDITDDTSQDCNVNAIPDECEARDCNDNGVPDDCELAAGSSPDCDGSGLPDECDPDCDEDGMPDLCELAVGEPDCNQNCFPDGCDIASAYSADCNNNGIPDECEPDCNNNDVPDECDIVFGTSEDCNDDGSPDECASDCNSNGTPDVCESDCNSNGVEDTCDIEEGISQDIDPSNGVPDECDHLLPIARIVSAVTRKYHSGPISADQDIPINITGHVETGNLTSEPRRRIAGLDPGAITELRISFDANLNTNGQNPVTVFWQAPGNECAGGTCPGGGQDCYTSYTGTSSITALISGPLLVLTFTPGVENVRTYKLRINTTATRVASQAFEVRCLKADVNSSGRVDAVDRSIVISVWTGPGYSISTDLNLDGATNAIDRSIVVGVWVNTANPENCAP